jgi:TolB-like protein
MSDVFISYGHSTARQAQGAAKALRALGYSVWIDDDLPAHRAFSAEIQSQLAAAKAALVIWSAEAATSDWVLSEANRAREARKLVQLRIDAAALPMPFDQIQCADMSGWSGEGEHPAWRKVAASVADLVNGRAQARVAPSAVPMATEPLLAVLAFDNLSGDAETSYFSDGVSEEIQQTVARGADLKVIGRASSFLFRGPEKRAARVAAELKATHVLDGSVRRSGQRVRIAAQLIECAGETTLWSDRYDRDLTDIFALQDEIAASVAAALKTAFARARPNALIDPAAFDLFLRAQARQGLGFEATDRQLKMLEEVVARAAAFARGWATLAFRRAYALRVTFPQESSAAGLTRELVVQAAETALRLDPQMGRAYQALSLLEPFGAYRERGALHAKALAVAPNDASVIANAAAFSGGFGRLKEGLALTRQASSLDPLAAGVTQQLGLMLGLAGLQEEAGRLLDMAVARWPESETIAATAIFNAGARGDWAKLESLARSWAKRAVGNGLLQEAIWYSRNLIEPDPESIKGWLEAQRSELARTGTVRLTAPVRLHRLGLPEEAFDLFDKASFAYVFDPEGPPPSTTLYAGAMFSRGDEAFYQDPRFLRLCAKLGLCDYWVETGKWPDCADEVPYDFRAGARRLAAART